MRTFARMRIWSKKKLREFWQKYPDAEAPLQSWYKTVDKASYDNLAQLKRDFPSADLVGICTVFNIGGNKYRLIVKIDYKFKTVFVVDVYTHKEYDKGGWKHGCNC